MARASRITRDPAFGDYHAWNIATQPDGSARLTCVCGLNRIFSSRVTAEMALKIHMS